MTSTVSSAEPLVQGAFFKPCELSAPFNWQPGLLRKLDELRCMGQFCDVTIQVDDTIGDASFLPYMRVHSVIVAAGSPMLHEKLQDPSFAGSVLVAGVGVWQWEQVINFLYTGKVCLTASGQAEALVQAAIELKMEVLVNMLQDHLGPSDAAAVEDVKPLKSRQAADTSEPMDDDDEDNDADDVDDDLDDVDFQPTKPQKAKAQRKGKRGIKKPKKYQDEMAEKESDNIVDAECSQDSPVEKKRKRTRKQAKPRHNSGEDVEVNEAPKVGIRIKRKGKELVSSRIKTAKKQLEEAPTSQNPETEDHSEQQGVLEKGEDEAEQPSENKQAKKRKKRPRKRNCDKEQGVLEKADDEAEQPSEDKGAKKGEKGIPRRRNCDKCRVVLYGPAAVRRHTCAKQALKRVEEAEFRQRFRVTDVEIIELPLLEPTCRICEETFPKTNALKAHIKEKHGEDKVTDAMYQPHQIPIKCPLCPRKTVRQEIVDHVWIAHGKKVNKSWTFGQKDNYYRCPECGYRTMCFSYLQSHIARLHRGHKAFMCDICGQNVTTAECFRNHMRIHTDERPFKCPHCPKAFRKSSTLVNHIPLHMDYKPYSCNLCGKQFAQINGISHHFRHHHPTLPKEEWKQNRTLKRKACLDPSEVKPVPERKPKEKKEEIPPVADINPVVHNPYVQNTEPFAQSMPQQQYVYQYDHVVDLSTWQQL